MPQGAGRNRLESAAGRVQWGGAGQAGARSARRPIAAGPPSPGGWGCRRRNVPRLRRRASAGQRGGRAQSGGGGRARTDVPGAPQPPSRPAARGRPAARAAPPAMVSWIISRLVV